MRLPLIPLRWRRMYQPGVFLGGFVVGILFLELNGYRFSANEADAAQAVLALAAGTLDEAGYAAFLRANSG